MLLFRHKISGNSVLRYIFGLSVFIASVFLVFLSWYLVIRFAPLSYWANKQFVSLKFNPVFNSLYIMLFARPFSYIFPDKQSLFYIPVKNEVNLWLDKDFFGNYKYEGFGFIDSLEPSIDPKRRDKRIYYLTVRFLSGRMETLLYDPAKTDKYYPTKGDEDNYFTLYLTGKAIEFENGDYIRIVFDSPIIPQKYYSLKNPTDEKEPVLMIHKMPQWLKLIP